MTGVKKCRSCERVLPVSEFPTVDSAGHLGLDCCMCYWDAKRAARKLSPLRPNPLEVRINAVFRDWSHGIKWGR